MWHLFLARFGHHRRHCSDPRVSVPRRDVLAAGLALAVLSVHSLQVPLASSGYRLFGASVWRVWLVPK
ncbi:hypothetical protein GCM10011410_00420 [Hoyosella rhizosphaerae]|uniref:Uncharacterized protein n=1 Tax=Hoyosella rhizosphaerae TaxID=1755582 RepID=A0A916TYX2_9ACTN|nr:hypothetical protein GCM10011410_00420 [Hoyosella rhizosphaerae]